MATPIRVLINSPPLQLGEDACGGCIAAAGGCRLGRDPLLAAVEPATLVAGLQDPRRPDRGRQGPAAAQLQGAGGTAQCRVLSAVRHGVCEYSSALASFSEIVSSVLNVACKYVIDDAIGKRTL